MKDAKWTLIREKSEEILSQAVYGAALLSSTVLLCAGWSLDKTSRGLTYTGSRLRVFTDKNLYPSSWDKKSGPMEEIGRSDAVEDKPPEVGQSDITESSTVEHQAAVEHDTVDPEDLQLTGTGPVEGGTATADTYYEPDSRAS